MTDSDDFPEGETYRANLNPDSLVTLTGCRVEPSLAAAQPSDRFQFERLGYFRLDPVDATADHLVFNRAVSLRDTWAKIEKKEKKQSQTSVKS